MVDNLDNIGSRIKQLREKKGLTQADLAKLIGCTQAIVAAWEVSKNKIPQHKYLNAISRVFNIEIDFFSRQTAKMKALLRISKIRSKPERLMSNVPPCKNTPRKNGII